MDAFAPSHRDVLLARFLGLSSFLSASSTVFSPFFLLIHPFPPLSSFPSFITVTVDSRDSRIKKMQFLLYGISTSSGGERRKYTTALRCARTTVAIGKNAIAQARSHARCPSTLFSRVHLLITFGLFIFLDPKHKVDFSSERCSVWPSGGARSHGFAFPRCRWRAANSPVAPLSCPCNILPVTGPFPSRPQYF